MRYLFEGQEVYVDQNGMAHDDEGNSWPANGWEPGTYWGNDARTITNLERRSSERGYGRRSYRASDPNRSEQMDALKKAMEKDPANNFLRSLFDQMARGRDLSPKQKDAAKKILIRLGGSISAKLFEKEHTMLKLIENMEAVGLGEADSGVGLKLRDAIRKGERDLNLPNVWLPSEDSIMDAPTKYNAQMRKVLKIQDQIRKLHDEYSKMEVV